MSVRAEIMSFLKQRRAAAIRQKVDNAQWTQIRAEKLLQEFDKIRDMGEWRHLREIYNQRHELRKLLPSPFGGHAKLAERMAALIERSELQAAEPRNVLIYQSNRARLAKK